MGVLEDEAKRIPSNKKNRAVVRWARPKKRVSVVDARLPMDNHILRSSRNIEPKQKSITDEKKASSHEL
ncbi:hypothetical protein DACRYDRAFT_21717 [Dacryopinax primogenitus]|uniref:Uncharacterized protein n=1 Tax=Dacryopinax primogenitus (strain DJM 731) TaxID=1858805 RepID=M5GDW0_DACPD|nr:uncharacterized protein DACRYDRAFT_21717 [Dacryopinax primogenitus]EJU02733.1 hypothetical protein DACRYDRAFT_21717 [Dacryopinax primogenitus]